MNERERDEVLRILAKVVGALVAGALAEALEAGLGVLALLEERAGLGGGPLANLALAEVLGELGCRLRDLVLVPGADKASLRVRDGDEEVGARLTVLWPE